MLHLKPPTRKDWKAREKKPPRRKTISTDMEKNQNKHFQLAMKKRKIKKNFSQPEQAEEEFV
jgi:hypothetical protein